MDLREVTSPELGRAKVSTLVVPLGATEQHGPHLPLLTDTIIAEQVAARIVAARTDCAIAPAIPIGASGEHAGFPGTLSIGTEALGALIVELVRDASRDYERVVIVNAHGGNAAGIAHARRVCEYERRRLDVLYCAFPRADAHAGRTETSVMLAIAPHLVRLSVAEPGNTAPISEILPLMREGGVRAASENGILGDPTGATAAEGVSLLDALVEKLLDAFS